MKMTEKEIRSMYLQVMCDLLNESKLHNFRFTDKQLKKIASKKVLDKLDEIELQNKLK
jgi:hypothetical protein